MKITGIISNIDYINTSKFLSIGPIRSLSILPFIFPISLVPFFIFLKPEKEALYFLVAIPFLILIYFSIRSKIWLSNFNSKAECPNIGECAYEISDDKIIFTGNQFNCTIPAKSIKEISKSKNTHYLKFSNYSGFIIPNKITNGDVRNFILKLKEINPSINIDIQ